MGNGAKMVNMILFESDSITIKLEQQRRIMGKIVPKQIRVFKKSLSGITEIPMKLTNWSRIKYGLFVQWPPQSIEEVDSTENTISIEFKDPWIPFDKPIMPFNLDKESQWRAEFIESKKAWKLKRIRTINY